MREKTVQDGPRKIHKHIMIKVYIKSWMVAW